MFSNVTSPFCSVLPCSASSTSAVESLNALKSFFFPSFPGALFLFFSVCLRRMQETLSSADHDIRDMRQTVESISSPKLIHIDNTFVSVRSQQSSTLQNTTSIRSSVDVMSHPPDHSSTPALFPLSFSWIFPSTHQVFK